MEPYYTPTHLVRNNISHGSLDKAGEDDIDSDAELAELLGRGLGEADDPRLAGGVVGVAGEASLGENTGDIDYGPCQSALFHQTSANLERKTIQEIVLMKINLLFVQKRRLGFVKND